LRFEELVQRVGRVRKPQVPQRIGHQQVAELVVDIRRGRRMVGQQCQSQNYRQRRQQQHAPAGSFRQPGRARLEPRPPEDRRQGEQKRECQQDEIARAKTERVTERQERAEKVGQKHGAPPILADSAPLPAWPAYGCFTIEARRT
jgi:hypothetical protein